MAEPDSAPGTGPLSMYYYLIQLRQHLYLAHDLRKIIHRAQSAELDLVSTYAWTLATLLSTSSNFESAYIQNDQEHAEQHSTVIFRLTSYRHNNITPSLSCKSIPHTVPIFRGPKHHARHNLVKSKKYVKEEKSIQRSVHHHASYHLIMTSARPLNPHTQSSLSQFIHSNPSYRSSRLPPQLSEPCSPSLSLPP